MATKRPGPHDPPAPAADLAPRLSSHQWPVLALLAAATSAVFAGVLRSGWIPLDDSGYVYENPHVVHGLTLEGLRWFLHASHGGNWHPLTSWSHLLDVQLFGLAPMGHHAVSLALHVLTTVLLAVVLHRMTGAWWRSVLVAGLFALHPLRVESVAWISERKDVLSGLFFVLALAAYLRWVERPAATRYALLVAVLALGLMAKPMLVTLPFVLVLLDIWPLGRWRWMTRGADPRPSTSAPARSLGALILEKWPLLVLAMASSVVTFIVQRSTGAVVSIITISAGYRISNALISYWRYVAMTFWPQHLAVFYPYSRTVDVFAVIAAAAAMVAVTVLVVTQLRKRPYLAVGWLWYVGMLVPVIGLIQVGGQAYADRYTYLPTIGLAVAVVWGAGDLVSRSRAARITAAVAAVSALAGLSVATVRQVALWKDSITLFTQAVAVTRDNFLANQHLGHTLLLAGQARRAIPYLEEAIRLAPGFADAHKDLGCALGMLGRYDEAIARFRTGLATRETAEAHHNLAFALAKMGRLDEAIPEYEAALRLEPTKCLSLVQLGAALGVKGRFAESAEFLRRALELNPADEGTRRVLAATLVRAGRLADALRAYGGILRRNPDDLDALNNVAWIRATCADAGLRDGAEAIRLAERARDKSPEPRAVLYGTLAAAYAEAGRFPEAVRAGERAVELARGAGAAEEAAAYARQLRGYRAGRPFHFEG